MPQPQDKITATPVHFAHVKFLADNVRSTVAIDSIRHFSPDDVDDFNSCQAYLVKWQNEGETEYGLYKAQILALGESKEEIEEKISNSRLKVPKVLDTSVESSSDDDQTKPVRNVFAKEKKAKKASREISHVNRLKNIISEKLDSRRQLFCTPSTSSSLKSATPSTSSPETPPSSDIELRTLKRKLEATKRELEEALEDNKKLRAINKTYQENVFETLNKLEAKLETAQETVPSATHAETDSLPIPINTEQQVYGKREGKIYLGGQVWMDEQKWQAIHNSPRHSLFVKNLALGIWGTETLKGRSVGGKFCPKFKGMKEAKPGLTPTKLEAVRNLFRDRLAEYGFSGKALKEEEGKLGRYLSEKIQDINRTPKQKEHPQ